MLDGIQLHLVGERLFAGQDGLPLQIGVHHCDHRFIVRQLPDDDGHRLDAQHLTRRQSPVAGDQLVTAVRQRLASAGVMAPTLRMLSIICCISSLFCTLKG